MDFIKHVLGKSQFASDGMLLMIVGGIGVYLRALPQQLWSWIVMQTTMMITVKDDDVAFVWVKEWLLEQEFLKRIRRVDLDTTLRGEDMALIPAPGNHWFSHAGRPFWVWFYRSQDRQDRSQRRSESLTFRTIGRDRQFLKQLVEEVIACHKRKVMMASLLYVWDDGWTYVPAYSPRSLDSVILQPGEKEHLIADVAKFRTLRQRYRRLGVPYHRGYLLYGPPGTGKTSLVSGLAAKFGLSIYAVNLTDFNDRTLKNAINEVPQNSVILFEDIDCMKATGRRREAENDSKSDRRDELAERLGVTLSGLLNVLDGFHAPDNVVFVMTTNKVEELDSALMRPGRIDYKLFMGEAAEIQKVELYRRFFPNAKEIEAKEFAQSNLAATMAEFQGLLLALEQKEGREDCLASCEAISA